MSEFDFKGSMPPSAQPLKMSHESSNVEADLKSVFAELFALLGKDTFDASVLGAAHLGSFDLVRKSVNRDGLVLLAGEREEAATRYLYRAWQSGDAQKRGLHFVRTYLQLLFPGESEVKQLWHVKNAPYGTAFITDEPRSPYWYSFLGQEGLKLDASWKLGRPFALDDYYPPEHTHERSDMFLTSRIEILLGLESIADGINPADSSMGSATTGLIKIIRSVIPARLIPEFRFWLRFVLAVSIRTSSKLLMQKYSNMRYPWCGRVLTENNDAKWQLGRDGDVVRLGLPMGSFKLSERRGGISKWKLKACRIESLLHAKIAAESKVFAVPKLGQSGLRLNGSWSLGKKHLNATSGLAMSKKIVVDHKLGVETTFHEHIEIRVPGKPSRLGRYARLSPWMRLDGSWSVGSSSRKLGGFRLGRASISTHQEISAAIEVQTDTFPVIGIKTLQKDSIRKLALRRRRVDGSWTLGSAQVIGRFRLEGQRLRNRKMTDFNPLGSFKLSTNEKSGLGYSDHGHVSSLPLDGSWKIGTRKAPPEFSMIVSRA